MVENNMIALLNVIAEKERCLKTILAAGMFSVESEHLLNEIQELKSMYYRGIAELENMEREVNAATMTCVYAPPEMMLRNQFIDDRTDTYPLNHSVAAPAFEEGEDPVMQELYGCPSIDPDETVKTCPNCGQTIPCSKIVCPYCGKNTIVAGKQAQETNNFFTKLFGKKNKR